MVLFNYTTREITAKIVYYGPGLGGKTTNLQSIYDDLPQEMKGKMLSLATKSDRTLFFDFLPIDLGSIGGMKVRVQLYTVPGQVYYNSTRKLVLKGADGVIFVADSQKAMEEANRESLDNLYQNLAEQNVSIDDLCLALQYNKRDLAGVMPLEQISELLNRGGWPVFEAVATQGIGVQETLREMLKLVVLSLKEKYDFSVGESALLEELDQVGEALKGSTASTEPPRSAVTETPAVESALTSPPPAPEEEVVEEQAMEVPEPVHVLSAEGGDALVGEDMSSGIFDDEIIPEMELFELDDEFLGSGEDDAETISSAIDDPYGDDSVMVIDEGAPSPSSDPLEIIETLETPGSEPSAEPVDPLQSASSGGETAAVADPASATAIELTIPGPDGIGDTEVTVPLNLRLNYRGEPLNLRFSLTLRLEEQGTGGSESSELSEVPSSPAELSREG